MRAPKDCARCLGCDERKQPSELVDGLCKSARYARALPKLNCVRLAAEREPLRFSKMLESVKAAMQAIKRQWSERPRGGKAA